MEYAWFTWKLKPSAAGSTPAIAVAMGFAMATPDAAIAVAKGLEAASPFSPITARPERGIFMLRVAPSIEREWQIIVL